MTQKEKLISLLRPRFECEEDQADYLLANGVTVPECKIGDTVYNVVSMEHSKHRPFIHEEKVVFVGATTENVFGGLRPLSSEKWGKEYFLNRAEAEAALGKLLEEYDGKS